MPDMKEMPNCPIVKHCHCYPEEETEANKRNETHCVCAMTEKALRGWINGRIKTPMTPEQREWCYAEIDAVESHDREDYVKGSDVELALGVFNAWGDYCHDKGLL